MHPLKNPEPLDREPPATPSEIDTVVDDSLGIRRALQEWGIDGSASAAPPAIAPHGMLQRGRLQRQFVRRVIVIVGAFAIGIAGSVWGMRRLQLATAPVSQRTPADRTARQASPPRAVPRPAERSQPRQTFILPRAVHASANSQLPTPNSKRIVAKSIRPELTRTGKAVNSQLPTRNSQPLHVQNAATLGNASGELGVDTSLRPLPTATPEPFVIAPVERLPNAPAATAPDADAVRQTLGHYADAYTDLDVDAAAALWPSVDRRALGRAFSTLRSQGLVFDQCDVDVAGDTASARCRGTLQYVRKVGSRVPRAASQQWRFRMRKVGAEWKIEAVNAS